MVNDKPAYYDQDMGVVYPVGFCSSRRHQSVVNPTTKCKYTSEVVDGGAATQRAVYAADTGRRGEKGRGEKEGGREGMREGLGRGSHRVTQTSMC